MVYAVAGGHSFRKCGGRRRAECGFSREGVGAVWQARLDKLKRNSLNTLGGLQAVGCLWLPRTWPWGD